ncbi:MAG: phosphoribosylformylglycinamidine synthase subunit PurL [bacterium]
MLNYKSMGLSDEEYKKIIELMGREPNLTELGIFSVMWSEHCGYKNSRALLNLFPTEGKYVVQGPGENAGIVDIGDGQGAVFKIESHNHPSAVEPYKGAATGVGGIMRDVFSMGARPVAAINSLRFGELTDDHTRWIFDGVVDGIAGYGNTLGVPTVAGEVYFSPSYKGNPLVNAMAVGILAGDPAKGLAAGVGNKVLLAGGRTGRDGVHGATFASDELDDKSKERREAIPAGNPELEKRLIEACLEVLATGHVVGMQDLGAAGLTSSSAEMASRAGTGIEMDLSLVPVKEQGLTPYEMMLSESQERMLLVVEQGHEKEVQQIFSKWDIESVYIGQVTDDGLLRVLHDGDVAAEIPVKYLTEEVPMYVRQGEIPAYLKEVQSFDWSQLPEPSDYNEALLKVMSSWNVASRHAIWEKFDTGARGNTVVGPGSDAAVVQVEGTTKGLAITVDGNGRYTYLDPYTGGMIAVAEAARNLAVTGAEPLGLTNGLNFGNPEKPEVYWQLQKAIEGMAAACRALDIPVVSGNVSLYNEIDGEAIFPTPIVGMVGLLTDATKHCVQGFEAAGEVIVLLGSNDDELGGSEYLYALHGIETGRPPRLDLDREARVQKLCRQAIAEGLLSSAHDVSDGGLVVAIAESCLTGKNGPIGATVKIDLQGLRRDAAYFGETQSRVVAAVTPDKLEALTKLAAKFGVPCTRLGETGGDTLKVDDVISLSLKQLVQAFEGAL